MLKCGHTANAYRSDGTPCCVFCNCSEPAEKIPDLTGREARCPHCGKTRPSDFSLPFFEYRPKSQYDEFYDGCFGWD